MRWDGSRMLQRTREGRSRGRDSRHNYGRVAAGGLGSGEGDIVTALC